MNQDNQIIEQARAVETPIEEAVNQLALPLKKLELENAKLKIQIIELQGQILQAEFTKLQDIVKTLSDELA